MKRASRFGRAVGVVLVLLGIIAPGEVLSQSRIIGRVTDSAGGSIARAIVFVQGDSTIRTTSNGEGIFRIEVEPEDTLVIEALGYEARQVRVGDGNRIDVTLESAPVQLGELAVLARASQSRAIVSGSASSLPPPARTCDGAALEAPSSLEPAAPPLRMSPSDPPPAPIPNACERIGTQIDPKR